MHWAAIRNFPRICELLLKHGADREFRDLGARTPLIVASQANSLECVKLLLLNGANPFQLSNSGKTAAKYTQHSQILYFLTKAEQIHCVMRMKPKHQQEIYWEMKGRIIFIEAQAAVEVRETFKSNAKKVIEMQAELAYRQKHPNK